MVYERPDMKSLTSQRLSGWEAGRIVLREGYWRTKGKGHLDNYQMMAIRNCCKPEEIEVFNSLLDLLGLVDLGLHKAQIAAKEVVAHLYQASLILSTLLARDKGELAPQDLATVHRLRQAVCGNYSLFKGYQAIMGEYFGLLDLREYLLDLDKQQPNIDKAVYSFNSLCSQLKKYAKDIQAQVELPLPIDPKKLPASKVTIKAWRDKIAKGLSRGGLGKGWWRKSWQIPGATS